MPSSAEAAMPESLSADAPEAVVPIEEKPEPPESRPDSETRESGVAMVMVRRETRRRNLENMLR